MAKNNRYIKSTSTFVKKKFHQNTNDGTIFERDWFTTGAVDKFLPNETPIYANGNFIITVNNDNNQIRDYETNDYEKINGTDEWTLEEINKSEEKENSNEVPDNLLTNKIYDLRDFAYFGSCLELVRGTINGLLQKFPGELYFSQKQAYYTLNDKPKLIEVDGYSYVLSNPFDINIHLLNIEDVENPLRYFGSNGYKNYEIIIGNGNSGTEVNSFSVTIDNNCSLDKNGNVQSLATIQINGYTVKYVKVEGNSYYLHNIPNQEIHIRPKKEFIDYFFDNLDDFERVLLNRNTSPKYTAKFNVIKETDYGIKTVCETYTFPTGLGEYNIGGDYETFNGYLNRLISVTETYDNYYSDNIYRMMTHETLKNFDFSQDKLYQEREDYQEGNDRLKKVLRIFGREFDVIRNDIEQISNNTFLNYKELTETQRKLLRSKLIGEGFDIVNIYPLTSTNNGDDCYKFSNNLSDLYSPYNENCKYYYPCGSQTPNDRVFDESISGNEYISTCQDGGNCIAKVFSKYSSENTFNAKYINDEFLKRLRLNSRELFKYKGTACGIEMILSMFGLKSRRMIKRMDSYTKELLGITDDDYDYDISEYYIEGIEPIVEEATIKKLKYYNSVKTITFDTQNSDNEELIGLPIIEVINEENGKSEIYPYFDDTQTYDGNMYYQMYGGWLKYNGDVFNKDNCLIDGNYTETIRNIRVFDSIDKLLNIPYSELYDGMVVKLNQIRTDIMIADSEVFNISYENNNPFITVYINNGKVYIGDELISDENGDIIVDNGITKNISNMKDGMQIKIFNIDSESFAYKKNFQYRGLNLTEKEKSKFKRYTLTNENPSSISNWDDVDENEIKKLNNIIDYYEGNNPHNGNMIYDGGEEYLERFRHLFKYALEKDLFDIRCFGSYSQYLKEKENGCMDIGFTLPNKTDNSISSIDDKNVTTLMNDIDSLKIMNLKDIKIDFSNLFKKFGNDINFKKYFLSVIMNYCQQFIPSTAICEINNQ